MMAPGDEPTLRDPRALPSGLHERALAREELDLLWTIERAEIIERTYVVKEGALVSKADYYDVRDWPDGEAEEYGPLLADCFEHGGHFWGVFDDDGALAAVAVLESRFIGARSDRLQLKFLHVSRSYRGAGVGVALFERAAAKARELGARSLYISATPSENTVHFYQRRGCRLAEEPDPKLFALEPEDIHLELPLVP